MNINTVMMSGVIALVLTLIKIIVPEVDMTITIGSMILATIITKDE